MKSPRSGFTLIEILVVVAILAILAALSLPAIRGGLAKARMAADTNSLRQIAAAMSSYVAENNAFPNKTLKIPGTESVPGQGDRWTFLEAVDRYFPPDSRFNPVSIYNFQRRPVWYSASAKPYPGFAPPTGPGTIPGPVAFGYNPNVDNEDNWSGKLSKMPRRAGIVIMAEANDPQGHRMDPSVPPTTANNVRSAYRTSHPSEQGLYLFCDFHVEALRGDRGYQYFAANSEEPNIWRWW